MSYFEIMAVSCFLMPRLCAHPLITQLARWRVFYEDEVARLRKVK